MKASTYFRIGLFALAALGVSACRSASTSEVRSEEQAVRVVEVRVGTMVEGRTYLSEVVSEKTVKVLAQVPGTVTALSVAEGESADASTPLVRIAAPDIAARVTRVRSERKRAERERDFACSTLTTDKKLAKSGDINTLQLERSLRACDSSELAVDASRAAEREAFVNQGRNVERAPFEGDVLAHLVDEGQTVMPGTPLLQYGSRSRLLRLRVVQGDLDGIKKDGPVESEWGPGHIHSVGPQAMGPGRLIEVLLKLDKPIEAKVGTTANVRLVLRTAQNAVSVPVNAVGKSGDKRFVWLVQESRAKRAEISLLLRDDGWVSVEPPLPAGSLVVVGTVDSLDPERPLFVVKQ